MQLGKKFGENIVIIKIMMIISCQFSRSIRKIMTTALVKLINKRGEKFVVCEKEHIYKPRDVGDIPSDST